MAVFVISQQILTNIAQINAKAKDNNLREFVRIWLRRAKGCLTHFRGLTEPLLYVAIQIIGQYLLFINCLLLVT